MWQGIQGHDAVVERFRRAASRGHVAGTYLLVGPEGIGKRSLAIQLAKTILCTSDSAHRSFDACGECHSCRLVDSDAHPDLELVAKRTDRQEFTIDLLLGDRQHRNREGLLCRIALKPTLSARKVVILDDADRFNLESANALLKTLEEPPPGAVVFLIGTSQNRQLPTIRSRSQVVGFQRLASSDIADLLFAEGVVDDRDRAAELAASSGGSLSVARTLADDTLWQFRGQILGWLSAAGSNGAAGRNGAAGTDGAVGTDGLRICRAVTKFVDEAGREAKDRRIRLRQVIGFAIDYYRGLLRSDCAAAVEGDAMVRDAVARTDRSALGPEFELRRLDLCIDAIGHIDRNANLATLIDWWIDGLANAA